MRLEDLNTLADAAAEREFLRCCGSTRWAREMAASRPFVNAESMAETGDAIGSSLERSDWLEAFAAHPRIGARAEAPAATPSGLPRGVSPKKVGFPGRKWATEEQAGAAGASGEVRQSLAQRNRDYEARFGYIFIVCATGKSADEMLAMLERRLTNDPDTELQIAAGEQRKITRLRLVKLLT